MRDNLRGRALLFFRIFLTAALIFALFKFVPYKDLISILQTSDRTLLIFGILIFFIVNLVAAARWMYIMNALGVRATYGRSLLSLISSYFFNLFFPSFIAGDIFRAASITSSRDNANHVISSVFMDRFSGSLSLAMVALVSTILGWSKVSSSAVPKALFILFTLILMASIIVLTRKPFQVFLKLIPNEKFRFFATGLHEKLYFFRKNPRYLIGSILISTPIHILTAYYFYINGIAFGLQNKIIDYLIAVPILMAISLIPITIAGTGTREAAAIYFLGLVGIPGAISLSLSLMVLFYLVFFGIIGGLLYLVFYRRIMGIEQTLKEKC